MFSIVRIRISLHTPHGKSCYTMSYIRYTPNLHSRSNRSNTREVCGQHRVYYAMKQEKLNV